MPHSPHCRSQVARTTRPTALQRFGTPAVALLALALLVQVLSSCGGGPPSDDEIREAAGSVSHRVYWAGNTFAALPLAALSRDGDYITFVYGDCRPDRDEGCSPPLSIQTVPICELNPLNFEAVPRASVKLGHLVVREYTAGRRMVNIGASTVILNGRGALTKRALSALRAVGDPAGTRLLRARYPRALVTEVRKVHDAYLRLGSIRRVRDELRISKTGIRFRLALAKELGSRRLRQRTFVHMHRDLPVMGAIDLQSKCEVEPS